MKKDQVSDIEKQSSNLYNNDEYILTPCRFAPSGWKYVKKDVPQSFLSHPNKRNSLGYYSKIPSQSGGISIKDNFSFINQTDSSISPRDHVNSKKVSVLSHYKDTFKETPSDEIISKSEVSASQIKHKHLIKEYKYPPLPLPKNLA